MKKPGTRPGFFWRTAGSPPHASCATARAFAKAADQWSAFAPPARASSAGVREGRGPVVRIGTPCPRQRRGRSRRPRTSGPHRHPLPAPAARAFAKAADQWSAFAPPARASSAGVREGRGPVVRVRTPCPRQQRGRSRRPRTSGPQAAFAHPRRWATPLRSSSSSARVLSMAFWLKSSTSMSLTTVYSPFCVVTAKPKITPSGMP